MRQLGTRVASGGLLCYNKLHQERCQTCVSVRCAFIKWTAHHFLGLEAMSYLPIWEKRSGCSPKPASESLAGADWWKALPHSGADAEGLMPPKGGKASEGRPRDMLACV